MSWVRVYLYAVYVFCFPCLIKHIYCNNIINVVLFLRPLQDHHKLCNSQLLQASSQSMNQQCDDEMCTQEMLCLVCLVCFVLLSCGSFFIGGNESIKCNGLIVLPLAASKYRGI